MVQVAQARDDDLGRGVGRRVELRISKRPTAPRDRLNHWTQG